MADIQLLLEAERRGLLPPDKQALLDEARRRGLIQGVSPTEPAAPEPERTVGGYAKEALKGLVPGLVGLGETAITGAAALLPEEAEQAVRRPVEEFAAGVREKFAPAPGYEDTAVRKVSEAVGSTLPFLPLGALGLAGRAAAVGLGVGAGAGEARQRAEAEAATEGERAAATALGVIPGALEALPPIRILRRFGFGDEAIKEVAGLAPALGRIARAGGEEALQEASSQVLQNLIAKGVYKPEEAVFGGVGEAAALGGGAGAVVSAIAELALGRRLRGPEAEPTAEEVAETEEELPTAEALAPKEGRVARAAPIRAKTREELAGLIPAAPKAAEEKVVAPREPMVFERTKEPTPEALQEAAEFAAQFPEGSKDFNLFKARSIAKKLGFEGISNKTTRPEIEPLIRSALGPRETVTPAEDVVVGQNAAGEQLYERQDGSRYRMRFDRADRPAGYPDFGGDLAPVEADQEVTVPETAQVEPDRISQRIIKSGAGSDFVKNLYLPDAVEAIKTDFDLDKVTPKEITESKNYIKELSQKVLRNQFGDEITLYRGIKGTEDKLPVLSYSLDKNVAKFNAEQQGIRTGEIEEIKIPVSEVLSYSEAIGRGTFAEQEVIVPKSARKFAEVPSEPTRASIEQAVVGAGARGVELPVSRPEPERREVAAPPSAGLEDLGVTPDRVVERAGEGVPALKKIEYKTEGPSYEQGLDFNYNGLKFSLSPKAGMFARPLLNVFGRNNERVGDYYANNERGQVDSRVDDASQIDQYNLPPSITSAIKNYLFSYDKGDAGVATAGKQVADAVNSEMAKYEAPAAPTRIFESIETLNRPKASFIDELGRERAPSLRRELGKIKQDYDAGTMTGDQFAETAGNLLLKTQKERIVQPRQRGAEFIRERLFNASRNGYLDPKGVELASWFVQQNPLLVQDLGVSIRQQPQAMEGTAAFYEPTSRIVTLFKDTGDAETATHEILHHTERLMPATIRANILKAYVKQLTKAEKKAKTDAEKQFFSSITNYHYFKDGPEKDAEYQKAIDAIQNKQVPKSYYQFVNPSEFWAINGARIVQGRYGIPPGIVGQIKKWLREFIEKAKSSLGLSSDAAIIRALDSLAKADGKYQTGSMLREAPGYRAIEPIAEKPKAKPEKPKKSVLEVTREASAKMVKPGTVKQTIDKIVGPETTYEKIVANFQNVNRKIKKIQQDLREAGRLVFVGPNKNNIDDQISSAANRSSYIVATEVEPVVKRLRESITDYARATKATIKDALDKASSYRIALHELERRETKYLRNVPLNNTTKEEFLPGEPAMTAADARAKLENRRSLAANKEQAEAIQDMIRYLAANYADPRGFSPVKAKLEQAGKPTPEEMTTDFYDDIYNVIGPEYTREALDEARQEYENLDPENKALVDRIFSDLDALHELNKNLNRRANYWTDKVDRVIESYGWKSYIPFKGSPKSDKTFDTDTEYLSGELSEAPESFEGRRTGFDNPILQTISESYFAASRAGRGTDVTQTIKNLIKLGVIKSKRVKTFSFEARNAPDFDYNQVRGRDKVLHYNEDGSVEVYSIKNPEVLEAIKTPFREMNWATKMGNAITSTLGQLHTRYNPAFAPMDFIRNSLTNAGLISAREGGKQAREYLTAVSANVARNGLWKSGKLSKLLAENRVDELNRLAKTDPFYRDALEMMQYGGRTMYRMSFNVSDTMEELQKQLGPKKILKDENSFFKYVDAFNDSFELTSRVGAYSIRKQQNIEAAKEQDLDLNDPKVMEDINKEAAAFALSLMDFRKIGRYGRELGAWFMFIRPAATGAVDAIDALRPGFMTPQKAFARLEPEVQELFETKGLAEEIKRIQGNKRPDKKKIAELEQEIANRQEAFDRFEANQLTRAKNARNTALFTVALGAALYGMAAAISGEDDEGRNRVTTDDMSRWTRYLRLPIIGDEGFFQIPWGFGVSGLMSAGAQTAALASGASSFKDFAGNMVEISIDSFLPIPASRINPFENFGAWIIDSATPSAARPLVEFVLNVDAMGNPIYNSRAGKYAAAFSGSTRPSEIHRGITQQIFNITNGAVDISPDTVAFFLNNYADAPNHLAENSWNLVLTAIGDKQFDAKKDTFVLRSFIGRNSNYDARKFAEAEKEIKALSRRLKTIEEFGTPEQLDRFYASNPNADILIDTYNKGVNGELRKLQQERKLYERDPALSPKERKELVDDLRMSENYIKKGLVEDFEAYMGN